jgi:ribosomal protein S18 acetylase RimI-like enzyme
MRVVQVMHKAAEITVRQVAPEDYEQLCELIDVVDGLHREKMPKIFQVPTGPVRERDYILGLIEDENVGLFIAEVGGQPAGFLHVLITGRPAIPIFVPQRLAVIDGIAVKEAFQGQGVGQALMAVAHEWAIDRGARSVELSVYEFNEEAIAFYAGLGYRTLLRRMIWEPPHHAELT